MTSSVLGKQNVQAKKVYYLERKDKRLRKLGNLVVERFTNKHIIIFVQSSCYSLAELLSEI